MGIAYWRYHRRYETTANQFLADAREDFGREYVPTFRQALRDLLRSDGGGRSNPPPLPFSSKTHIAVREVWGFAPSIFAVRQAVPNVIF